MPKVTPILHREDSRVFPVEPSQTGQDRDDRGIIVLPYLYSFWKINFYIFVHPHNLNRSHQIIITMYNGESIIKYSPHYGIVTDLWLCLFKKTEGELLA